MVSALTETDYVCSSSNEEELWFFITPNIVI